MVGRSAPRPAEVGILIGRIRSLVVKTWTIGIEAPLTTTPENGQTLAAYGDFASAEKKEWWLLLSISRLGGCRSWIRDGGLTYFDLSTASADFEAWLWVHGWPVNDMAIFKVKLGSVIGTHNAITHERTLRKRAAKVRARVGHGKETACATDQKNGYALNHRPGWFVLD
jgi:hypothetical protein